MNAIRYLLLVSLMIVACASAAAQSTRIGFVDTRRIEAESVPFVRALDALKREFASREQEVRALQKQVGADRARFEKEQAKLPPEERQRRGNDLNNAIKRTSQMSVALQEDVERRKRELLGGLVEQANAAIKVVAEAGKFDLVLQQATYVRPGIDITDQVLKEMARRGGAKP